MHFALDVGEQQNKGFLMQVALDVVDTWVNAHGNEVVGVHDDELLGVEDKEVLDTHGNDDELLGIDNAWSLVVEINHMVVLNYQHLKI